MATPKRNPDGSTGTPDSKLSQLVALMITGDWDRALAFANRFPRLGDHDRPIRQGHAAVTRPDFYRSLGKDPAALREAGIAALRARYAEALERTLNPTKETTA